MNLYIGAAGELSHHLSITSNLIVSHLGTTQLVLPAGSSSSSAAGEMGWPVLSYLFGKAKVNAQADDDSPGNDNPARPESSPPISGVDEEELVGESDSTADEGKGAHRPAGADVDGQPAPAEVAAQKKDEEALLNNRAARSDGSDHHAAAPDGDRQTQDEDSLAGVVNGRSLWPFRHLLLGRLSNAGAPLQDWLSRLIISSQLNQDQEQQRRNRLIEYLKKAIPVDFVLFGGIAIYSSSYSSISSSGKPLILYIWFACGIAGLCVRFVSASLIMNSSTNSAVAWPLHCSLAFVSTFFMMLAIYLVLLSFNKIGAYVVLATPLPIIAAAWIYRACVGGVPAANVGCDTLDHAFDISSGVYTIAAGGGTAGGIVATRLWEHSLSMHASVLGLLLFVTIVLAVYLMLVATIQPPLLTRHAELVSKLLPLLLAMCGVGTAVVLVGFSAACAAASIEIVEALVLYNAGGLAAIRSAVASTDRMKEQRLISSAVAAVQFAVLLQFKSKLVVSAKTVVRLIVLLRMSLYLSVFLWSVNRMYFIRPEPSAENAAWAWIQCFRTSVVTAVIVDCAWWSSIIQMT